METADRQAKGSQTKRPARCPNCDTRAPGNYCPHCGQHQKDRIVSTQLLMTDLASNYLTFDARLFRTLRPLFVRPGALTRAYVNGRRRHFAPPARLYVMASIAFFFVLSVTSTNLLGLIYQPPEQIAQEAAAGSLSGPSQLQSQAATDSLSQHQAAMVMDSLEAAGITISAEGIQLRDPETGAEINIERSAFEGKANTLLAGFIENLPLLMFLMLPAFAFLLKLLYARRHRYYVEHLIFTFHVHAFAFLLLALVLAVNLLLPEAARAFTVLGAAGLILFYIYRAMRRVYLQSRIKTIAKFGLLLCTYGLTLFTGFVATVAITAALLYA